MFPGKKNLKSSSEFKDKMDSIKIGEFLRTLRKEKNLTQQELAEKFMVSNRTISRWETGTNMPDISLLVEIADFFDVDIREIINGERKLESEADSDAIQEIASYADNEKEKLATKTRIYALAGLVSMILYVILTNFAPDTVILGLIRSVALIMVYVALASSVIFTTERLQVLRRKYKGVLMAKLIPVILIIVGIIVVIIALAPFFLIGQG